VLVSIGTLVPATGGDDDIFVGDGADVVFGGVGADYINVDRASGEASTGDQGNDVLVGDNGSATFTNGVIGQIQTSSPAIGGDDLIDAGDGNNLVIGGAGFDRITSGTGSDFIVGDNGQASFSNSGVILSIETTDETVSGAYNDTINAGLGADLVLGGNGSDWISAEETARSM